MVYYKKMRIYYTGIGCKNNFKHTEQEFIDIMNRVFTYKNWDHELTLISRDLHYQLNYKDWILPEQFILFSLQDWLDYSGAEIYSQSE